MRTTSARSISASNPPPEATTPGLILEFIDHHLPALIVVLPLVGGVLSALLGRRNLGWGIAAATTVAVLAGCILLLNRVLVTPGGEVTYLMSNWPTPFGIAFVVDSLNASVLLIIAAIAAVVTVYALPSIRQEVPADRHPFFWAIWLLCLTGLLGITITGDAFNLYVLLEISSLATYVLVSMGKFRERKALTSSINYLVLGTIGASFILLGIGFLYSITGTLNMNDMATRLSEIYATWDTDAPIYHSATITGFAFLMIGLCIKLALFPLHSWLPNAYTYSPSAVSALLAATATKVGAYIAIRFLYTIMGIGFAFGEIPTDQIIIIAASLAIVIGSWIAMRQNNLKQMLAYSSVAQIGYIALGFALANPDGLAGSIIHLFNHALTKGGMFLALGIVMYRLGNVTMDEMRGLGRRLPFTMAAFTVGGLGLIGVPLTAGFVSKWYLVGGAITAGRPELAAVILVGSILAVVYIWKVIEVIYFQKPLASSPATVREAPLAMLIPTLILIGASVYFGIDATTSSAVAHHAAESLLGTVR